MPVIKHAPINKYTHSQATLHIQSKTPFMSAVKHIEKMISKFDTIPNKKNQQIRRGNIPKSVNSISIKGMGKAISKTLNIAVYFKYKQGYVVDIFTTSIGVLDEEDDGELSKRNVGGVEVVIRME